MRFTSLFFSLLGLCSLAHAEPRTLTLASVDQRTVTVDAIAISKALPDKLEWQLQIKSVKPSIKESRAEVEASLQNLKTAMRNAGVPEQALVLADVEQGREYEWGRSKRTFKGYFSSSSARLTITDFKFVQSILSEILADNLISVGAFNQLSERQGELRQRALADAALVARKKAEILATTLGAKVGNVVQIAETSFDSSSGSGGTMGNHFQAQSISEESTASSSFGVQEITVIASIKVTFELVN